MSYYCCPLTFDADAIAHYGEQLGLSSPAETLYQIAAAIRLHPMWQALPQTILIVRPEPTPVLAVIGTFSPKAVAQIRVQQRIINDACRRLRYVNYGAATQACEALASKLQATLSEAQRQRCQFLGIPRGGVVVLGILAYLLDIRGEQLCTETNQTEGLLVVIDDCALSGARFGRIVRQYPDREIIFAPLFAHPQLRAGILEKEPQVAHCLSGMDLFDHGPGAMGHSYADWQAHNFARLGGRRYWLGLPDYLCFPWNEPDHLLWNPVTAALEASWRIIPPQYCLKHRPPMNHKALPIQLQLEIHGPIQPAPHIVFGELEGQPLIGNLKTGETFGLTGLGADLWQLVIAQGTLDTAIATVAQQHLMAPEQVKTHFDAFQQQLLEHHILMLNPDRIT